MLRMYKEGKKQLRIFLDGDRAEIERLMRSLNSKFYFPSDYEKEDDIVNIIFCEGNKFFFPAGLIGIVEGEIHKLGYDLKIDFEQPDLHRTITPVSPDLLEGITLRDYQIAGIEAALLHKSGILQVPTGGGKTEMMTAVCKYILDGSEGHILLCVPTSKLLHQTVDRLVKRGISENDISKYGDGSSIDSSKRVVVATVQTVYRRLEEGDFKRWCSTLKCLMMDEAHHSACRTWFSIIDALCPEYNLGVSAEPFYGDSAHLIRDLLLRGIVGPVIYKVPINYLIDKGYLSKPYMIAIETSYPGNIFKVISWSTVQKNGIIKNKIRNSIITDTALKLMNCGKNPLILVAQIVHGQHLALEISKAGKRVAFLKGGSSVSIYLEGNEIDNFKDKEGIVNRDFQEGKIDALIGTSIMDEGVDMPSISAVILAGGGKSNLRLVQRVGRGLRPRPEDNTTIIVDFKDSFNIVTKKHFKLRRESFDKMGIPCYYLNNTSQLESLVLNIKKNRP